MVNCVYKYWKWSNSKKPYGKSKKKPKTDIKKEGLENNNEFNITDHKNIKTGEPNKRDVCNNRISQRDMLIQTNVNPFLTKLNYVKNIETQENFLRPQDSNF